MPLLVFVYPFFFPECVIEERMTYRGNNIDIGKGTYGLSSGTMVENKEACAKLSFSTKGAKFWSYLPVEKLCWVKTSKKGRKPHPTAVSRNRACGKPGNQISTFNHAVTLASYANPYLHTTALVANWVASPDVIVVNIVRKGFKTFFGRLLVIQQAIIIHPESQVKMY